MNQAANNWFNTLYWRVMIVKGYQSQLNRFNYSIIRLALCYWAIGAGILLKAIGCIIIGSVI
jgi:hypothetical protein